MLKIPLTHGLFALIDECDAAQAAYKWYAKKMHGIYYAARNTITKPRTTVLLHRAILTPASNAHVDHINGDGLDCRRINMRLATRYQNAQNSKVRTGIYKGVSARKNRWVAQIRANGRNYWLGRFDTQEEAARAYDAAAQKLHGSFAKLNFPATATKET